MSCQKKHGRGPRTRFIGPDGQIPREEMLRHSAFYEFPPTVVSPGRNVHALHVLLRDVLEDLGCSDVRSSGPHLAPTPLGHYSVTGAMEGRLGAKDSVDFCICYDGVLRVERETPSEGEQATEEGAPGATTQFHLEIALRLSCDLKLPIAQASASRRFEEVKVKAFDALQANPIELTGSKIPDVQKHLPIHVTDRAMELEARFPVKPSEYPLRGQVKPVDDLVDSERNRRG